MKKLWLRIVHFFKEVGIGLLFLFVGLPIMAISGRQQMKRIKKEAAERKAKEINNKLQINQ